MPYGLSKRAKNEPKTSPLKAVSPIIRKYDGHRQKRIKICRKMENEAGPTQPGRNRNLKAILPKPDGGEMISVEPELLSAVNPSFTPNSLNILTPVQEICAIAKQTMEEKKQNTEKAPRTTRKRPVASSAVSKKKLLKHGKIIESALELLKPEPQSSIDAREEAYALNYFLNVKNTVSANHFAQFCIILEQLESPEGNVCKAFKDLTSLLMPHPELVEDFIPFLTAEQAMECGVFMQHLMLTKMADFLVLLETHFAKTPYQTKRILAALEKMSTQPEINVKEVSSTILPMLKGHTVLTDFFLEMLPGCRPPDVLSTDFDVVDDEAMSDGSEDGEIWERLELPAVPDPYGGDTCICTCHNTDDDKFRTRAQHCIPCSTKFINGKVFIQSGKFLRRAQVTFKNGDMEFHRKRLFPGPVEPRKRKRSTSRGKDAFSPSKSSHLSSDELRSDEDDRTKFKMKVQRPKTAKKTNKRVIDPENFETSKKETSQRPAKLEEIGSKVEIPLKLNKLDEAKQKPGISGLPDFVVEPQVKTNFVEKIEENGPCTDTVTFLTASEARLAAEARASKANDSKLKLVLEEEHKSEPGLNCVSLSSAKQALDTENTEDRNSPPVLSIPETGAILPGVVPLLSVLEQQPMKEEVLDFEEETHVEESNAAESRANDTKSEEPWTMDEDRKILHTLQMERYCEETFVKINEALPSRSVESIKGRFQALLNILHKMKAESSE